MRLAVLAAVALVAGSGEGWAQTAVPYKLQTNHVGCSNPQDLIDFVRMGKQAAGNEQLVRLALRNLFAKIDSGACHQYTSGTPVSVIDRQTMQDYDLECIKDEQQNGCFYVLSPAS